MFWSCPRSYARDTTCDTTERDRANITDHGRYSKPLGHAKNNESLAVSEAPKGPYGIRTRAAAVRGRCPRPLDEWAVVASGQCSGLADPREPLDGGQELLALLRGGLLVARR